jgi:hypothetical protein
VAVALAVRAAEAGENEVEADSTLLETGVLSCAEVGEGRSELKEAAGADADRLVPDLEVAEVAEPVNSGLGVACLHSFCGVEADESVEELAKQLDDFCLRSEAFVSGRIFTDRQIP